MGESQQSLETRFELLKKDYETVGQLLTRLDTAIEKLTDISNSVHRMLAVHDTRIAQQEEVVRHVIDKLESANKRAQDVRDECRDDLDEFKKECTRSLTEVRDNVNRLEKWKYYVMGFAGAGGVIAGYALSKMSISTVLQNFVG